MNLSDTIRAVQRKLGVVDDGKAGPRTWSAVFLALGLTSVPRTLADTIRAVQKRVGVEVDGDGGPQTWSAITGALVVPIIAEKLPTRNPFAEIAEIAKTQIGTSERKQHDNRGAALAKYFAADNYKPNASDDGYPWCASFVCWCFQEFFARHMEYARLGMRRPQTAAAFGLIDWGKANGCRVFGAQQDTPQPGDIVVFTFSHCGIVADFDVNHGSFHSIEGNSNNTGARDGFQVVNHPRSLASGTIKKFIRLPLAA